MSGLVGQMVGEYRLVEFLGAGGMGDVYRGEHSKIGRVVAVKILSRADARSDMTERFFNEARIQAGVQHKHIVNLYDFVEHNGRPCIIMEYVDGEMLDQRIERARGLQAAEAFRLFKQIVDAVAHLHRSRIVHRDIKSNNIKIDRSGAAKLLDFGIARDPKSSKVTSVGSYIGTMQYAAPEILSGAKADFRSDVWALGILCYEMLCGRVPFESDSVTGFLRIIARPSYDRPAKVNASCTPEMERIIDRCLEAEPGKRYASAAELAEDLDRLGATATPSAAPRTGLLHTGQTLTRGYGPIVAVGVAALALVVGLFAFSSSPSKPPAESTGIGPTPIATQPQVALTPQPVQTSGQTIAPQSDSRPGPTLPPVPLRQVSIRPMAVEKAEIQESGQVIGHTPFRQELPVGRSYHWTLRATGYDDTPLEFTVRDTDNVYSPVLKERQK
ncbi:MAG: hypothetical protein FJ145_13155 [Deltaproteobacteria bacterium]|nr:hypothetical protein [Deltaproteobacteria bacterium]